MKTLKERILEIHREYLEDSVSETDSLDISESGNECDFIHNYFEKIEGLTLISTNEFNYDNTDYNFIFNTNGLEVEIFENDEFYKDKAEKLNFTIEWSEFDAQMNDYK